MVPSTLLNDLVGKRTFIAKVKSKECSNLESEAADLTDKRRSESKNKN